MLEVIKIQLSALKAKNMIRQVCILVFSLIPLFTMAQKTISDWIDLDHYQSSGFNTIRLFVLKNDKKILVEKIDLNNKGLILKKEEYCNFLYDLLDDIEREIYEYDNTDTLLISRRYENEYGDTLRHFEYSYQYDSTGRLISKGTVEYPYKDYECENYYYNDFGLVDKERINFYNETKDSIRHFIDWIYLYDKSGNRIHASFAPEGIAEFERIYKYDSLNNLISYETEGIHQCGDDIDRYKITYNSDSEKILSEMWNASGNNWAYGFQYDKSGKLIKETNKTRYLKRKYRRNKSSELPPPLPQHTQDMLEKNYTDEYEYKFIYDSKERLVRVTERFLKYNLNTDYIIEYE